MALDWEREDERSVGVLFDLAMMKTDPEESMQVRRGQAVLKVMDDILDTLLKTAKEEESDDVQES